MDQLIALETIAERASNEAAFYSRRNLQDRANAADQRWIAAINQAAAIRTQLQRSGRAA